MDQWSYEFFEAWMDRTLSSAHEHESDISSRRGPEIVLASVARIVCDGEVQDSKLYVAADGPTPLHARISAAAPTQCRWHLDIRRTCGLEWPLSFSFNAIDVITETSQT